MRRGRIGAVALAVISGCAGGHVLIGPPIPPKVTIAPPGTQWTVIPYDSQTTRGIRWFDAQRSRYYEGPYDPNAYRAYGVRSYCAFLPSEGDAYVSEVKGNEVKSPPPVGCPA